MALNAQFFDVIILKVNDFRHEFVRLRPKRSLINDAISQEKNDKVFRK